MFTFRLRPEKPAKMTSTDYLRLSEHKIFKAVRDTLPANLRKTQNVLIIKDDVLFTWDFQSNCVLTLNVKTARSREGDNVAYQVGCEKRTVKIAQNMSSAV